MKSIFSYKGRIGRKSFWLGLILPVSSLAILIGLIPDAYTIDGKVTIVCYAILTWVTTTGFSKRLHDRDHSGWFQLIFLVPASSIYTLSLTFGSPPWIVALGFVTFLTGLWVVAEAGFMRGTLGHNRFAEDPALYDTSHSNWRPHPKRISKEEAIREQVHEPQQKAISSDHDFGHKAEDAINQMPLSAETATFETKDQTEKNDFLENWYKEGEPEILRSTATTFGVPEPTPQLPIRIQQEPSSPNPPMHLEPPVVDTFALKPKDAASGPAPGQNHGISAIAQSTIEIAEEVEDKSLSETERFLETLQKRATKDANHALYLQNGAKAGNSWAKLEIAATWLSDLQVSQDRAELAVNYLRELADSKQSYLGAETEAAYFLGEIYRVGMRYTRPNEDLNFKYFIRAAALGHETAQHSLAAQVSRSLANPTGDSLVQPLINDALHDTESAKALMELIELNWSITYSESVALILRTLVDQGNGQAARILGRILLERDDLELSTRILSHADKLDAATIDKIVDVIQIGSAEDRIINDLVDLLEKHAEIGDPYAHYQMAVAFNTGTGMPQDNLMAFVHINIALARVHGRERDKLIKLRDNLRATLADKEIMTAQEIIREKYRG